LNRVAPVFCQPIFKGAVVAKKKNQEKPEIVGFLGVGLDNEDGEHRLTRNESFLLVGGSQETHERMQDASMRFNETLKKTGRELPELPVDEVVDMLREAHDA